MCALANKRFHNQRRRAKERKSQFNLGKPIRHTEMRRRERINWKKIKLLILAAFEDNIISITNWRQIWKFLHIILRHFINSLLFSSSHAPLLLLLSYAIQCGTKEHCEVIWYSFELIFLLPLSLFLFLLFFVHFGFFYERHHADFRLLI